MPMFQMSHQHPLVVEFGGCMHKVPLELKECTYNAKNVCRQNLKQFLGTEVY